MPHERVELRSRLGARHDAHRELRPRLWNSTLEEPSIEVVSIPIAEIDGWDHSRDPTEPLPITSTPSNMSAPARKSPSSNSMPSHSNEVTPSTATLPSSSCSVAEQPGERHHRVGNGAAEDARVERVFEGAHGDDARDIAAQGRGQRGLPDLEVAHVAHDEQVACEQVGVCLTNASRFVDVSSMPSTISLIVQGG